MTRTIEVKLHVDETGYVGVQVDALLPLHVVEMALAEALATVQRELLAVRLGYEVKGRMVTLAPPKGEAV